MLKKSVRPVLQINNVVCNLDCLKFLSKINHSTIDLVVTDPPYNSLQKHRSIGTTTRLKKFFPVVDDRILKVFIRYIYEILKPNSHFYCFCNFDHLNIIKCFCEEAGFKCWKALIWNKDKIGMGYHYRAQHEYILFLEKGKRKINNLSIPDVLTYKPPWRKYPTEKPVELLELLINQSSSEGDIIVDPFCGSGSIIEACINTKRNYICNDIYEEAYKLSRERSKL